MDILLIKDKVEEAQIEYCRNYNIGFSQVPPQVILDVLATYKLPVRFYYRDLDAVVKEPHEIPELQHRRHFIITNKPIPARRSVSTKQNV